MKSSLFRYLDKLEIFVKVVEQGSFAKAAEVARITQPAISHAIKTLETALGGEVFIRTSRGVEITNIGKVLYEFSIKLSEDVLQLERNLALSSESQISNIEIGTKETYAVSIWPKFISDLAISMPKIKIAIRSTRSNAELIGLVKSGQIDAAVIPDPGDSEDLVSYEIFKDQFAFYIAEGEYGQRWKRKSVFRTSEISTYFYGAGLAIQGWRTGDIVDDAGLAKHFCSVESYHMSRAMMLQGLGAALLPVSFAAMDLERKLIRPIEFEDFDAVKFGTTKVCFCISRKNSRNKILRSILTILKSSWSHGKKID